VEDKVCDAAARALPPVAAYCTYRDIRDSVEHNQIAEAGSLAAEEAKFLIEKMRPQPCQEGGGQLGAFLNQPGEPDAPATPTTAGQEDSAEEGGYPAAAVNLA